MEKSVKERLPLQKEKNIETVKKQITTNLIHYIQKQKKQVSLQNYIKEKETFLSKVWDDAWKHRLISSYSKEMKTKHLESLGINTSDLKLKQLNMLFCEQFTEHDFSAKQWLMEEYSPKWDAFVREIQKEKNKEMKVQKKKYYHQQVLRPYLKKMMDDKWDLFYLYIREEILKHLKRDMQSGKRYILDIENDEELVEIGFFEQEKYEYIYQFWDEFTGVSDDWDSSQSIEYETYEEVYRDIVFDYIVENFPKILYRYIDSSIKVDFEMTMNRKMEVKDITKAYENILEDYIDGFMDELESEKIPEEISIKSKRELENEWKNIVKQKEEERLQQEEEKEKEEELIESIFGFEKQYGEKTNTKYILHLGDTNTGKTFTALERLKSFQTGIYLAPLRLLALEVYEKLNRDGVPCRLKTGEEEKRVEGANHTSCTIEMFREEDDYDVIIIDEVQMITDKERGFSWYRSIVGANAKEVHIIGNPSAKEMVLRLLGDADVEVREYKRQIPLTVQEKGFQIRDVQEGDALVTFSRQKVLQIASKLESDGHKVSIIYGNMPPDSRQKQIEEFIQGKTKIVVATDAIGMGLNLPIKRIIFMDSEKFDGTQRRMLTSQEVKQIAGRAGRKGLYEEGIVVFTSEKKKMKKLLQMADKPIETFTVAPTRDTFERFSRHFRDLDKFFELWKRYKNPKGTKKALLSEEKMLYHMIKGTVVERSFSLYELYHFLQIPFSTKDHELAAQWKQNMFNISYNKGLVEPIMKKEALEELELSYKSVELHLMFLYRLNQPTEAYYWERVKKELSEDIHQWLKQNMHTFHKKCKDCNRNLEWDYPYGICQKCYNKRYTYFYNEDETFY